MLLYQSMTNTTPTTDRRAHERRVLHGTAELRLPNSPAFPVHIIDVSLSGIRVVAPINPREGTVFLLRMRLPTRPAGSLPVETRVQVAFSILTGSEDGFTLGLSFLELPPAAKQAIRDYLPPS